MADRRVVLPCQGCGTLNRVPVARLGQGPRCGGCKVELEPGHPLAIASEEAFQKVVLESDLPVLVDFWAPWCAPCRALAPVLARFASQHAGRLLVAKVNTDEQQALAGRYRISGIPTLLLFVGGRPVQQAVGALPPAQLAALVAPYLPAT
ncbi:MAG: thioredoxin TrxC [Myxococcota bacterium]|jgi:thioredoxin 2|nr:thioredoxin TrxC [Myxococcota bacterium]